MIMRLIAAAAAVLLAQLLSPPSSASDCSSEASYRASPGGTASDIFFRNGSAEQRRVYWLDESGQRKLKSVVEPGRTERIATVAGHHWVVTDGAEKCLYVIVAAAAAITAEIGTGQAIAPAEREQNAPTAAASTVTRLGLSGWYQLGPVSQPGQALNNMQNGRPEIERVKAEWDSAYWQISDIPGSGYVTITNKWTQKNLAAGNGGLQTIVGAVQGQGAQWSLESTDNGSHILIKSRFNGRYLVATGKGFDFVDKPAAGTGALWQLARATRSQQAEPKPVPVPERARPDVSRKCPSGERFDPDRLDCVSIKCGRHQFFSKSEGQCLDKSGSCGPKEVYSSSLASCIPKEQPQAPVAPKPKDPVKPKPQVPKVPKCAFKTDGAGNCLTPQFLACQKAYGVCMKACKSKNSGKCEAACHSKYAGTCGD